jgi:hypothetical protein
VKIQQIRFGLAERRHSSCASRRVWTSNVSVGVSPISIVTFPFAFTHALPVIRLARYSGSVAYSLAFSLPGKCLTGRPFRLTVGMMRPGLYRHHLIGFVGVVAGHFTSWPPAPSLPHVSPSKDQFLSERKKRGRSRDSALAATSISGSGILYDLRSRRAHRIAWR